MFLNGPNIISNEKMSKNACFRRTYCTSFAEFLSVCAFFAVSADVSFVFSSEIKKYPPSINPQHVFDACNGKNNVEFFPLTLIPIFKSFLPAAENSQCVCHDCQLVFQKGKIKMFESEALQIHTGHWPAFSCLSTRTPI